MISEIQTKLQKHNKIVFTVLLALIIVAFVFTIGNMPGIGGGEQRAARADYFGYNLHSERDVRELMRLGELSYRIEHGDQMPHNQQLQAYVLDRLAYQGLADRLHLPPPTEDELRHFLTGRAAFQNEQGVFDVTQYSSFIDSIDADPQVSTEDVAWVLEQDYRINEARKLLTGPGYVLPTEVRLQLERNQALWSMDLATLNLSEFQPEIEVTDEQLETFFEENSFRYEREPRISFSYVLFDRDAFLDQVPELPEQEIAAHFENNRAQFTPEQTESPDGETNEAEEPQEVTLADVRDQVETSLRQQRARRLAGVAASDFAYALFQQGARPGSENFEELLANYRGEVHDAPPASRSEFPWDLGFSREAQDAVFNLSADRDFSDPVRHGDDYLVLIYNETLPAYIPPMEEVKEDVERDFRAEERRRLLAERGQEIRNSLISRMSEGASFIEAAEAEELSTQSVEDFSRLNPPSDVNRQLVMRLDEFEMNEVSQMVQLQNTGYFVFLKDRTVPEIDPNSEEFTSAAENLRTWSSMGSGNFALQEFVRRETTTVNAAN